MAACSSASEEVARVMDLTLRRSPKRRSQEGTRPPSGAHAGRGRRTRVTTYGFSLSCWERVPSGGLGPGYPIDTDYGDPVGGGACRHGEAKPPDAL